MSKPDEATGSEAAEPGTRRRLAADMPRIAGTILITTLAGIVFAPPLLVVVYAVLLGASEGIFLAVVLLPFEMWWDRRLPPSAASRPERSSPG